MRWFSIRKAGIDPELRKTFERYGRLTMQTMLATNSTMFRHQGSLFTVENHLVSLLSRLTEEYDKEEIYDTWLMTMEAAITIFVLSELVFSIINFAHGNQK
jgi:hypothetical protein